MIEADLVLPCKSMLHATGLTSAARCAA